jgi:hypothetical protein
VYERRATGVSSKCTGRFTDNRCFHRKAL